LDFTSILDKRLTDNSWNFHLQFIYAKELPTEEKIEPSYLSSSLQSEGGIQEIWE